jgi:hypothetical protein
MNAYCARIGTFCPVDDMSGLNREYVACIAGHAYLLATGKQPYQVIGDTEIERVAAEYLGLTYDQGLELFIDLPDDIDLEEVESEWAINVLELLITKGQIRWWAAFPDPVRSVA